MQEERVSLGSNMQEERVSLGSNMQEERDMANWEIAHSESNFIVAQTAIDYLAETRLPLHTQCKKECNLHLSGLFSSSQ